MSWYAASWHIISEMSLITVLAVLTYMLLQPEMASMQQLDAGWITQIWLRNMAYTILIAGGLQLYFYRWRQQGRKLKYEANFLSADSARFTFSKQLWDNVVWSLASGVTLWTAYEVLVFWAQASGIAPLHLWADGAIWFLSLFMIIVWWESLHFYWVHRLLHWPPLYKAVHSLHHRNINTGPWSGISMHPVEHLIYFSSVLIHFVLPSHPIHIIFHMYVLTISAIVGHSGFEGLLVGNKQRMALGHFHHQLHHRYFECNYGTSEMPWDVWFGSFHDGTREARQRLRDKHRAKTAGRALGS